MKSIPQGLKPDWFLMPNIPGINPRPSAPKTWPTARETYLGESSTHFAAFSARLKSCPFKTSASTVTVLIGSFPGLKIETGGTQIHGYD
jgi:hypothetical protein